MTSNNPCHKTISKILSHIDPTLLEKSYNNFIPGKFEYINDENSRIMFINAWEAITLTDNWEFMKQPIISFSYSDDPRIVIISKKMTELGYDGHSGSSFGSTMRTMQYIAIYGENKYMKLIK